MSTLLVFSSCSLNRSAVSDSPSFIVQLPGVGSGAFTITEQNTGPALSPADKQLVLAYIRSKNEVLADQINNLQIDKNKAGEVLNVRFYLQHTKPAVNTPFAMVLSDGNPENSVTDRRSVVGKTYSISEIHSCEGRTGGCCSFLTNGDGYVVGCKSDERAWKNVVCNESGGGVCNHTISTP